MLVKDNCLYKKDHVLGLRGFITPTHKSEVHENRSHKGGETQKNTGVESSWRRSGQERCRNKHAEHDDSKSAVLILLPIEFVFLDLVS